MVPIIDQDYFLLLGYTILNKEYNLNGFNHQKKLLIWVSFHHWELWWIPEFVRASKYLSLGDSGLVVCQGHAGFLMSTVWALP